VQIVLASTSPRRRDLMQEHGYRFTIRPPVTDEVMPPHLTVGEMTLCNARRKAQAVAALEPDALVIGVDTLVAFEGEALGKPADMAGALAMIRRLNGRIHEVYSGLAVIGAGQERATVEVSRVRFRHLDETALRAYLARIHPLDKAGAYAAQDEHPEGVIDSIEGSRTNVIGLPMEALATILARFGISPPGASGA